MAARRAGLPLALTWGMTETASQICTWVPGEFDTPGAGPPQAFARVTADSEGRLTVSGPVAEGVHLTQDLGRVDADGCVEVTGRADEILNSGGAKFAPAEIEAVLAEHAGVAESAVVGRADIRFGSRPVAFVRPACPGLVADAENGPATGLAPGLRAHCRDRLPAYKCPDHFVFLTELPRLSTGKVDRRALAERAAALQADAPRKEP